MGTGTGKPDVSLTGSQERFLRPCLVRTGREDTMDSGFVPRITIPDSEDRATVMAALIHYSKAVHKRTARCGDVEGYIHEIRITTDLLSGLVDTERAALDTALGLALPSDDEIADFMNSDFGSLNDQDDDDN